MKLNSLKSLDSNPRKISKQNLERLKRDIQDDPDYMKLRSILVNEVDGERIIYAGNQRYQACIEIYGEEIPDEWVKIEKNVPMDVMNRRVLRDNQEYGEWDNEMLIEMWGEEMKESDFPELDFYKIGGVGKDDLYTNKIVSPEYVPSEEPTPLPELCETQKTDDLIEEINASKASPEVKEFLRAAAMRHVVFDYSKIANYYASANKEVQEMMEKSALVIIDFDKAVENGFVSMSEYINKIRYEDED